MRPSSFVVVAIVLALAALLAVYVPLEILKGVSLKALDPLFGGVIAVVSIIAGAGLGFFALTFATPFIFGEGGDSRLRLRLKEMEERLLAYRARQRAMLEELDGIKRELEEILKILKEGMGV